MQASAIATIFNRDEASGAAAATDDDVAQPIRVTAKAAKRIDPVAEVQALERDVADEILDDEDVVVVKTPPVRVHSVILKITGTIEQLNEVKAAMEKAGVTFRKVEF